MAYNGFPPFQPHSPTSKAAAAKIARRADSTRTRALNVIRDSGAHGATSDEVQRALKLPHQTGSARVAELLQDGFVVESGRRRKTVKGCWADVLVVAPDGTPAREARQHVEPEGFTHSQLAQLRGDLGRALAVAEARGFVRTREITKLMTWLQRKAPGVRPGVRA